MGLKGELFRKMLWQWWRPGGKKTFGVIHRPVSVQCEWIRTGTDHRERGEDILYNYHDKPRSDTFTEDLAWQTAPMFQCL